MIYIMMIIFAIWFYVIIDSFRLEVKRIRLRKEIKQLEDELYKLLCKKINIRNKEK